jgi:PAS domain S-box-containing protein
MLEFLKTLFSSDNFMPHGHCYLWNPGVLWLHITSDALIAAAYYSIPFTLVYFTRHRKDVPFNWMFLCFATFIVACGTTHLMEIWVIWHPTYWLSGLIKAVTALVSVPTAILLLKLVPQALVIPSPTSLRIANAELQQEIAERKRAEAEVRRLNAELEDRVRERTLELEITNRTLTQEAQERHRAEQAARENQKLLHAIIDNSSTIITVKDLAGRFLLVNRRFGELFRRRPDAVVGLTDRDIFASAAAKAFQGVDAQVISTGQALTAEEIVPQDDGQHTYISVKGPLIDDAGAVRAVFGISTDITERKQTEEKINHLNTELEERVAQRTAELEAANRELEAFSYSVSHDLRAPLRAINGFAEILLQDFHAQLPEKARHYLDRVRYGGQQMGQLIDDLLAFARLGRQPLARQPVAMHQLVQEVIDCTVIEKDRKIEFKLNQLPASLGDPGLLKQVWVNLLSNAVKYSRGREVAVVEIGSRTENGKTTYFVRDNGVGFDIKYAHKLFGVFQRLHRPDEFEGTGVGLAIVQRVIHRHGGRVWAEAVLNHGATFYFTLEGVTP